METGVTARANVALEVGVVTVEADIPQLQTEQSAVGAVVRRETIENMSLINRHAAQLARLNGFIVQNGRGNNAMWTLDGGIVQNLTLGVSTLTFNPPVEALQEFNVNISNYSADMSRTGDGMVRMTTRSGTNQYHGCGRPDGLCDFVTDGLCRFRGAHWRALAHFPAQNQPSIFSSGSSSGRR